MWAHFVIHSGVRAGETLSGDTGIGFSGESEIGINAFGFYRVDGGIVANQFGLHIAENPSASGEVIVTGPGTDLSLGPGAAFVSLMVGRQGSGVMTISGGAVVDSSSLSSVGSTAGATVTLPSPILVRGW